LDKSFNIPSPAEIEMPDVRSVIKNSDIAIRFPEFPLREEEAMRTVAIEVLQRDPVASRLMLFFYFFSRHSRDKFYNCMRILRLSVDLKR